MSLPLLNDNFGDLSKRKTVGDIGIELEIEHTSGKFGAVSKTGYWQKKPENSLRNGVEFTLRKPIAMKEVELALKELGAVLDESGKLRRSIRCSTHIHVNVLDRSVQEIYNAMAFYFLIEDILVATQGPVRMGNLFCLRMSDAEGIVEGLVDSITSGALLSMFHAEEYKYGALNLNAPAKFGSLEFRFLRPMTDMTEMFMWTKALHDLVNISSQIPIAESLELVQNQSALGVLSRVFDEEFVDYIMDTLDPSVLSDGLVVNYDNIARVLEAFTDRTFLTIPPEYIEDDLYTPPKRRLGSLTNLQQIQQQFANMGGGGGMAWASPPEPDDWDPDDDPDGDTF